MWSVPCLEPGIHPFLSLPLNMPMHTHTHTYTLDQQHVISKFRISIRLNSPVWKCPFSNYMCKYFSAMLCGFSFWVWFSSKMDMELGCWTSNWICHFKKQNQKSETAHPPSCPPLHLVLWITSLWPATLLVAIIWTDDKVSDTAEYICWFLYLTGMQADLTLLWILNPSS